MYQEYPEYAHQYFTMYQSLLQQVSQGLRLLPEDADGAGAVADGGAQEEPQEAR